MANIPTESRIATALAGMTGTWPDVFA